jgi:archaellum component FlaC
MRAKAAIKTVTTPVKKRASVMSAQAWMFNELAEEARQDKLCEKEKCGHFYDDFDDNIDVKMDMGISSRGNASTLQVCSLLLVFPALFPSAS